MTENNCVGGFDHIILGVDDLEAARETYRRLGFTLSPRGRHMGWGTANYCIMFEGEYIELIGIVDPSQFTNNLDKRLAEKGEGLLSVAYAAPDAASAHQALSSLGAEPPRELKRLLELPEGTVELHFRLVHLPPAATPGAPAFVIQHLSRDLVWRPEWLAHANGAKAITSVTARVGDLGFAAAAYVSLFGGEAVSETADGVVVRVADASLVLEEAGPDAPEGPVGFAVGVDDLERAARVLAENGIGFERGEDALRVAAGDACGAALAFVRIRAGKKRPRFEERGPSNQFGWTMF